MSNFRFGNQLLRQLKMVCLAYLSFTASAYSQWAQQSGTQNYTFTTSSSTFADPTTNPLSITNSTTAVTSINATISTNGGAANGVWPNGNNTSPINFSMFPIFGYAAGINTNGAAGPTITANLTGNIAYSLQGSAYGGGTTANGSLINTFGPGSVISVISNGIDAATTIQSLQTLPDSTNGGNGGNINLTIGDAGGTTTLLQLGGPSSGTGAISSYNSGLPWQPSASVVNAQSVGGNGAAWTPAPGYVQDNVTGNGGNGGSVAVQTYSGTTLQIGSSQYPVNGQIAGISAISLGGAAAICCYTPYGGAGEYFYQYSLETPSSACTGTGYQSTCFAGIVNPGQSGNGGPVTVNNGANIDASQNILPSGQYGGNITGIVAASVGGAIQINPNLYSNVIDYDNPLPAVGLGGNVEVTNYGNIILPGQNSIGILAASTANQTIIPSVPTAGSGESAGSVSVTNNGIIQTGNNTAGTSTISQGAISGGIFAISSTGWLVNPTGFQANTNLSAGNGGSVNVTNNGSISSFGNSAIGIAALSIGNSGFITNNGTTNNITYLGSGLPALGFAVNGDSSTVMNFGNITTQGQTAIGILAVANGSGGILSNDLPPTFNGSALTSGVIIGNNDQAAFAANGGVVSISNYGTITTGIPGSGGEAAIGIVAQSVGGGGGSVPGSQPAASVGDDGGAGGNGGQISVSNFGAISTMNDGAISVLAQSIGGGGGNGGNSSSLFVAVGGSGGSGGDGGLISIQNGSFEYNATINTSGDYSAGIIAQSIGGGGGNGGYAKSYGLFFSTGIGGTGGNGGAISFENFATLNNYSTISTSGDQSQGVLLQSIGGGGGNGGAANSYSAGVVFSASVAVGGSGGKGGSGGDLGTNYPITNYGGIYTNGNDATAFLAQSIGGGGGNGGSTLAKSIASSVPIEEIPTINFSTSIGGAGGSGGNGGQIILNNNGPIITSGSNSLGILAQSIGKGGGNGGDSSAGANASGQSDFTLNVSTSVGGSGSGGGSGGTITITNSPDEAGFDPAPTYINTFGNNSVAILAQSIGGGGGTGGTGNASETNSSSGANSVNASIGIGGTGGTGGTGGVISVTNAAPMTTVGSSSSGIVAQSIGGGGGHAGSAGTQGVANSYTANIAIGGNGGAGGASGNVTIINTGRISTGYSLAYSGSNNLVIGGDSHGIVAQSIAGGGGNGGSTDPMANLVSSPDSLIKKGANDYIAGKNIYNYLTTGATFPKNYQATVGVGGNGGVGGQAGNVTVNNDTGAIQTLGHRSFGILAQSIGGGGGTGGSVMNGSSAVGSSLSGGVAAGALTGLTFSAGVNVGGSGGSASNGGTVTITQTGNIVTAGYGSYGVLAQSVGGGGGVGADGSIAANQLFTGSASFNHGVAGEFSLALGSIQSNPSLGSGGTVNYGSENSLNSGTITTYGDHAVGIVAQSIGGGGGVASGGCTNNGTSANASACLANTVQSPNSTTPAVFIDGGQAMSLAINPTGTVTNTPSNGGAVNVYTAENVQTSGDGAIGLVAQSIGGGGGLILANVANISSATLPVMGSTAGTGGTVTVVENGSINTSGAGAWGILAQSIGGGGGFIGDPNFAIGTVVPTNVNNDNAANLGGNTAGGAVNVALNGSITTTGENAHGIFAQSIGGGGGVASFNGGVNTENPSSPDAHGSGPIAGSGGPINITIGNSGSISALGLGSVGIFAQSQGNSVNNQSTADISTAGNTAAPINIAVNGSVLATTGIIVAGGNVDLYEVNIPNTVTINQGATVSSPNGGWAIIGTYGTTNVVNSGTITGGINLATSGFVNPAGEFTNTSTGIFNATGPVIVSNDSLKNYGVINIAGRGIIGVTDMWGSYKQYTGGKTIIDVNTTQQSNDYLRVLMSDKSADPKAYYSAGTFLPGGTLEINRIDDNRLPARGALLKVLTAEGGFLGALSNLKVTDSSPLVNWALVQHGNDISFTPTLISTPIGIYLNRNQQSFLNYVAAGYNAYAMGLDNAVGRLISNGGTAHLVRAIDSMNGANGAARTIQQQALVMGSNSILGNALSCSNPNRYGDSGDKSECVWGKITGGLLNQSTSENNPGFRINDNTYSAGAQGSVAADTFVGGSVRFGQNTAYTRTFSAYSVGGSGSVGVKKVIGNYFVALSAAGGISNQSNNRTTLDYSAGQTYNMHSNSNLFYGGLRLRNAYQFNGPLESYIKPYLDLDALWSHSPSFGERAIFTSIPTQYYSAVPLQYNGLTKFNFIASPMVELGGKLAINDNNAWIKPFVAAGGVFITRNNNNSSASIMGANAGSYEIFSQSPGSLFKGSAGLHVFSNDNIDLKFEYNTLVGYGFRSQGGSASLYKKF